MVASSAAEPRRRLIAQLPRSRVSPLAAAAFLVALAYGAVLIWLLLTDIPYSGSKRVVPLGAGDQLPASEILRSATDDPLPPVPLGDTAAALPPPLQRLPETAPEPDAPDEQSYPDTAPAIDALPAAPLPGLVANGPDGPLPVISSTGERAWQAYGRPSGLTASTATLPRVALIVGGLGISETATRNAIETLPPEVTLSFAPYGRNLQRWIDRAREAGHEVLLELPMEPYDYPANDPGPYTLLTSLSPADNLARLSWLMSRFTGYAGVTAYQGAKFSADRAAMEPILDALESRGLMYVDPGVNPRTTAPAIAEDIGLTSAKGDRIIDPALTPRSIDDALKALEDAARTKGAVVGLGSGFPVTVSRVSQWAQDLADRGVVLVPVTATAGP